MSGIFVSGTDTGVGKTVISAGLTRLARSRGINCVGLKPVETGCPINNGMLQPLDGTVLWDASDRTFSLDVCAPYRFAMPASPFRAAAMEDGNLTVSDLVEHVLTVSEDAEMVIVEGAGGLMAPVEDHKVMIDVISALGFPTLLVGRLALGTINHTMLSLEALVRRNIPVKGIVLSASKEFCGPEEDYTPGDLSRMIRGIPVVVFPFMENMEIVNAEKIAQIMIQKWPPAFIHEVLHP